MSKEDPIIKNRMLLALFDEYQRVIYEYIAVLKTVKEDDYLMVKDEITQDPDCKSIHTISLHIVHSGYTYANYLNEIHGVIWQEYDEKIAPISKFEKEIVKMLTFTHQALCRFGDLDDNAICKWKIDTRWSVTYDVEQLMEHAIVHILRHRRQIENFKAN